MKALLLLAILAQDEVKLEYKFKRGQKFECRQTVRLVLDFKGDEDTVDKVKALHPFLSFKELTVDGDAEHETKKTEKEKAAIQVKWKKAKCSGNYADEDFEYTFSKDKPEQVGDDDKLKQMMYFLFVAGRAHDLYKTGECEDTGDKDKDLNGEILDLFAFCHPRFPDKALKVGEEWAVEWKSRRADKETGKHILMKQVGKLEKVEGKLAHLTLKFSGEHDVKDKEDANPYREAKIAGEATVVFNIEEGRVVKCEAKGENVLRYKGSDPNGLGDFDVTIILKSEGKREDN